MPAHKLLLVLELLKIKTRLDHPELASQVLSLTPTFKEFPRIFRRAETYLESFAADNQQRQKRLTNN